MSYSDIAAVLRERYGLPCRAAARQAHGWTQQQAADEWRRRWPDDPIEQKTLSGWECWPESGRPPSLRTIERMAELYEMSASDLVAGWADYRPCARTEGLGDGYPADVDRREFLGLVAGGGVASSLPVKVGRIGSADVGQLREQVLTLWHADEAQGGGAVYQAVMAKLSEVRGLLDRASFGPTIGRDLQVIAGQLTELAGFAAFDAGDQATARSHFHEALTIARVADDDPLAVYVMAQLANLAQRQRNGREVVELTRAAQRTARGFAPPRLVAVLSSREAEGHGLRRDSMAAQAALGRAEQELTEASDDGEAWFAYFVPEMLAVSASRTWLSLDAPVAAERAARESIGPALARRPRAMNCVRHAHTLVACGQYDRAAAVTVQAVELGRGVSSHRMRSDLMSLRPVLEAQESVRGVPEALAALVST